MAKILRLILGDQLNAEHSWFSDVNQDVTYLMMEVRQETDYVTHHIQKVVAFFAAMRNFAKELKKQRHRLHYIRLDDDHNQQDLADNINAEIQRGKYKRFEYLHPDEYRLDQQLKKLCKQLEVETKVFDTEHFITNRGELGDFFGAKRYLMESFYRQMRKKHGWLMDNGKPAGRKWNYDRENRKALPQKADVPSPYLFNNDVASLVKMIETAGVGTIGTLEPESFIWPVCRSDSLQLLDFFIDKCLADFGKYQDALHPDHWSLFHSRISFSLNTKMLGPMEVVEAVLNRYHRDKKISLASVEGFVRQIVGWREFMRGIYWAEMPEYAELNVLHNTGTLPRFYWHGRTRMACLAHAIGQSLDKAYAHHIQRLMITGNFALLAGVHPDLVDAWYLGIYIDAVQWVEITNARGMSQFADGGMVATKPYVSSANYINKMSNYCKNCYYDCKKKTGEKACPFNSLYYHFLEKNSSRFAENPRMKMMYLMLAKVKAEKKRQILAQAEHYLETIDSL